MRQVALITIHYHDQTVKREVGEIELMGMMGVRLWSKKVREISIEKISMEEAYRMKKAGQLDKTH